MAKTYKKYKFHIDKNAKSYKHPSIDSDSPLNCIISLPHEEIYKILSEVDLTFGVKDLKEISKEHNSIGGSLLFN